MIFVECVKDGCGEAWTEPMPDRSPAYCKMTCEKCGTVQWLCCSRIQSWSLSEEDFLKKYDINYETKTITEKKT